MNNRLRGKTLDNIGRVVFASEGFVSDMTYDPDPSHWWRVNFQWRIAVSGILLASLKLPTSGDILTKWCGRELTIHKESIATPTGVHLQTTYRGLTRQSVARSYLSF